MMHDFAMTAEHIVLRRTCRSCFNLDVAIKSDGDMPYRWDDGYGARLGVMRRDDPFGDVRWFDIGPVLRIPRGQCPTTPLMRLLQVVRYPGTGGKDGGGLMPRRPVDDGRSTARNGIVTERQLDDRAVGIPANR